MADVAQKENIMGTQKMSKLILFTGIPLMISLFINSLYNFVDSMFVSQVSEKALTALSLAAPVQLLVSALGLGNAEGLNAVISKALGKKDTGEVRRAAYVVVVFVRNPVSFAPFCGVRACACMDAAYF